MPVINIKVKPSAPSTRFRGVIVHNGEKILKIDVAAPPEKGRANEELIKFLAKKLRISRSDVRLKSGETSRDKRLEIPGFTLDEILKILED